MQPKITTVHGLYVEREGFGIHRPPITAFANTCRMMRASLHCACSSGDKKTSLPGIAACGKLQHARAGIPGVLLPQDLEKPRGLLCACLIAEPVGGKHSGIGWSKSIETCQGCNTSLNCLKCAACNPWTSICQFNFKAREFAAWAPDSQSLALMPYV